MFGFRWFFYQVVRLIVAGLSYIFIAITASNESLTEQNLKISPSEASQSENESFFGVTLQKLLFADDAETVSRIGGGDGDSPELTYSADQEWISKTPFYTSIEHEKENAVAQNPTDTFYNLDEFSKIRSTTESSNDAEKSSKTESASHPAETDQVNHFKTQITSLTTSAALADPCKPLARKSSCKINLSNCDSNYVRLAARSLGMKESTVNWDVCWSTNFASIQRCKLMNSHQRINHFPGSFHFSRKDHLAKNLNWMHKNFPADYNFFPKTWVFPEDVGKFYVYARRHPGTFFIYKPNNGSSGEGIVLSRDLTRVPSYYKMTTQVYVERPFLIDGFKFDFRIYVLLSSIDPLTIFVYDEGFARFATVEYKHPTDHNSSNEFMHLTNTSVNIQSESYVRDEYEGNYRKMSTVLKWFKTNGYDDDDIKDSIDDVVIKTILSCLPTLRCYYKAAFPNTTSSACFELFGFDIMFDHKLKTYLLEVNCSPSLQWGTGTSYEKEVKKAVVFDTFNVLNLSKRSRYMKSNKIMEARQNNWESSHVGNFRKIYPPPRGFSEYYQKFIDKGVRNPYIYVYP